MSKRDGFRGTISKSIELTKQGQHNEALELFNGAIAESLRIQEREPTCALCRHAAAAARFWESITRKRCATDRAESADADIEMTRRKAFPAILRLRDRSYRIPIE